MNFKNIHIGQLIENGVTDTGIEMSRIRNFFKMTDDQILKMYASQSLETELLLKWSKLLDYDFFRVYTQHLIFYSPPSAPKTKIEKKKVSLPQFRKNIYTQEVISFILESVNSGEKTKLQVIEEYNIPKTTLYKWLSKNKK